MAVGVARRQTGKDDLLRRKLQMPRQRKRPAGPHRLRAGRQPARDRGEHERLDEHAKIRPLPRSDPAVEADEESYRRAEAARSEDHTSELQSLMRISYAVSCLKKKIST